MKRNKAPRRVGLITVLLAGLTGCTTYVVQQPDPQPAYLPPQSAPVIVEQAPPPPPPVVVIQQDDDFVQPLSPYGRWVVVGDYGRCWQPSQVEVGWRPYTNGHWELTPDGWYWVSDEPWAWATYHYGRWQLAANYGWVWVPETVWAPAWVSWRSGGGYVGWAPLPPERRGGVSVSVTIAPAAFCFVDEHQLRDPVRPTTVIVNNTTIINKTVVITKTKIVNKVVVNEGPRVDEVERVTGRQIKPVAIADLRDKEEEPVAQKHANLRARPDRQPVQPKPEPKQPEQRPAPVINNRPPQPQRPPTVQNPRSAPEQAVNPRQQRDNEKPAPARPVPPPPPAKVQEPPPKPVQPVPPPPAQPTENRNPREQPTREQTPPAKPQQQNRQPQRAVSPKQQQQQNENNPRNARTTERGNRQNDGTNATDNSGQRQR
jgi:hypothetical protein